MQPYNPELIEFLKRCKVPVALTHARDSLAVNDAVIDWRHIAAVACQTKKLDSYLAKLIGVTGSLPLKWPTSTESVARESEGKKGIDFGLKLVPGLVEQLRRIQGRELALADISSALWETAESEWKTQFAKLNGLAAAPAKSNAAFSLFMESSARIEGIKNQLLSEIKGQDAAISEITEALFKSDLSSGRQNASHPSAVFLFAGSPGVGKTLTAEVLGRCLGKPVKRFDMSSYVQAETALFNLIGVGQPYSGSQEGEMTGFVKKNPEAVLIFDEIEKAAPVVLNLFLQILDFAVCEDKFSKKNVSFGQATIIFTTNAGRALYENENRSGMIFDSPQSHRDTLLDALKNEGESQEPGRYGFPAALCSRLGAYGHPILFRPLTPKAYEEILTMGLEKKILGRPEAFFCPIKCEDQLLKTLFILMTGPDLDARKVAVAGENIILNFIYQGLSFSRETFSAHPGASALSVEFQPAARDLFLKDFLEKKGQRVLLVDDNHAVYDLYSSVLTDYDWSHAVNKQEALKILSEKKIDFILHDLNLGDNPEGGKEAESGIACLKEIHRRYANIPTYINSRLLTPHNFDPELFQRCVEAGGARGYLKSSFASKSDAAAKEKFRQELEDISYNLMRENILAKLLRSRERVSADYTFNYRKKENEIVCLINFIKRQVVPTSAATSMFMASRPGITLADVAGNEPAKDQLREIVEWLSNPAKYALMNAHIKKGILLEGPPGTGKTLLARAAAGEAKVPFIPARASEFLTVWQGSGAENVRKLFATARKHAPAIIFIDEIDSIGMSREGQADTAGSGRQLLTQLLSEMDGFEKEDVPVIVIAATNREKDLDKALTRPGRFDEIIHVGLPDKEARKKILKLHAQKKPFAKIDWLKTAESTYGWSGAELERLVNEAAIIAAKADKKQIEEADLEAAFTHIKFRGEAPKKVSDWQRDVTATHEAGHALLQRLLFPEQPIKELSIISRGTTFGYMQPSYHEDIDEKGDMPYIVSHLSVLLGGYIAEELVNKGVTWGSSSDLSRATKLSFSVAGNCAMGIDKDFIAVESVPFPPSDKLRSALEERAGKLLSYAAARARELLEMNQQVLKKLNKALLEKDILSAADVEKFWDKNKLES